MRERWASMLHRIAMDRLADERVLTDPRAIAGFADEHGHRRAVDPFFLAALHGTEPPALTPGAAVDVRWWWHAATGDNAIDVSEAGALTARDQTPLEVWTETELSALHALWRLARVTGRADWRARARACARWHVHETQPDNATNHPWAIHVFVMSGEDEGQLYAEGLLHACQVGMGRADVFSALVLLDAARELAQTR